MILWKLRMERRRRRSAITRLMVDASLKIQVIVGVLSRMVSANLNLTSWVTRAASSRSEFMIRPFWLSYLTRSTTTSEGYSTYHTKCSPSELVSSHIPPMPSSETSTKPKSVTYLCKVGGISLHRPTDVFSEKSICYSY